MKVLFESGLLIILDYGILSYEKSRDSEKSSVVHKMHTVDNKSTERHLTDLAFRLLWPFQYNCDSSPLWCNRLRPYFVSDLARTYPDRIVKK